MRKHLLGSLLILAITSTGCTEDDPPLPEPSPTSVDLDFTDGTEAYLMAVYALPKGSEAAGSDFVSFSLTAGGAPATALRLGAQRADETPAYDKAYWDDRIAWEGRRHANVNNIASELRAGRWNFERAVPRQDACGGCPDNQYCQGTCTATPSFGFAGGGSPVDTTVLGTVGVGGVEVTVLLDQADAGAETAAQAAAADFANSADDILAAYGQSGGHGGALDLDGDGRMAVIFSSRLQSLGGGNIVGYFDANDFVPTGTGDSTGNDADILWARVPTQDAAACPAGGCAASVITHEVGVGTLVHEYTHLINYAVRVHSAGSGADNEVQWLDEGLAHMTEDLTGWGQSNIGTVVAAFDEWPTVAFAGPEDSPAQRGVSFLMLRHIAEAGASGATAADVTVTLPGTLLGESELGWMHPTLQQVGSRGVWEWLVGVFATNNTEVTQPDAQAYDYKPIGTKNGQIVGVDPRGEYIDARGVDLPLDGPTLGDGVMDELTDFADPYDSEVVVSGTLYYIVTGLEPGTATIDMINIEAPAGVDVDVSLRAIRVW